LEDIPEFYSAIKKNELQIIIILSEVSQVQKAKDYMFPLICGMQAKYKCKQYYEKQITLRGGHIQEREGKRRKLKRIWSFTRINIEL
jgi:hypothetical protein